MSRELTERERLAWLRLARTPNVGPSTFANLIARFGSAEDAIREVPGLARRGGSEKIQVTTEADASAEMDALLAAGGRALASIEPAFPPGLAAIEAPPPIIELFGNSALLQRETIAIVGARNASGLGRKFANSLAGDLSQEGLVVSSGMARGIDAAAHEGAMNGGTVAVLAGGIDNIYPPENRDLYGRLSESGAIISEMPFGFVPQARHFPRRNRIISGLARGVVIVEAAQSSGSLITANFALEQGREVFAVPGSPLDPRAKGTNKLLRDGATLVETAEDVLAVLRPIIGRGFEDPSDRPPLPLDVEADVERVRPEIARLLSPAPIEVDELVRQLGVSPGTLLAALLELELAGRLARHPGNKVCWA